MSMYSSGFASKALIIVIILPLNSQHTWGETNVLKWAESKGLDWYSKGVPINAVVHGHVGTFEWVHTTGRANTVELLIDLPKIASKQGDIAMLICMQELNLLGNGEYWWHSAATGGQIDVLDWLCDNGYVFTDDLPLTGACSGFQIEVFAWASQRGIDWKNELTCNWAACYGNLPCLKWLRENGCPWGAGVISSAHRCGYDHIAEWAITNGCPTE